MSLLPKKSSQYNKTINLYESFDIILYLLSGKLLDLTDNLPDHFRNGLIPRRGRLQQERNQIIDKQKEPILQGIDELFGEFEDGLVDLGVLVLQQRHDLQVHRFHLVVVGYAPVEGDQAGQQVAVGDGGVAVHLDQK